MFCHAVTFRVCIPVFVYFSIFICSYNSCSVFCIVFAIWCVFYSMWQVVGLLCSEILKSIRWIYDSTFLNCSPEEPLFLLTYLSLRYFSLLNVKDSVLFQASSGQWRNTGVSASCARRASVDCCVLPIPALFIFNS